MARAGRKGGRGWGQVGEETSGEMGVVEVMAFNAHVAEGKRGGISAGVTTFIAVVTHASAGGMSTVNKTMTRRGG